MRLYAPVPDTRPLALARRRPVALRSLLDAQLARACLAYACSITGTTIPKVAKLMGTRTRRQFSVRTVVPPILSPGPRGGPECFMDF
jgi:hypothetical protein